MQEQNKAGQANEKYVLWEEKIRSSEKIILKWTGAIVANWAYRNAEPNADHHLVWQRYQAV